MDVNRFVVIAVKEKFVSIFLKNYRHQVQITQGNEKSDILLPNVPN